MSTFRFKRFSVIQDRSALKLGTDAVMLGAAMTLEPSVGRALDIGTGTGVIALMVAQRLSDAGADFRIKGIDIDGPSAGEAALNFSDSPWSSRMEAECRNLKEFSPECSFDLIFSNPPYFDDSLCNPDGRLGIARHTSEMSWRDILDFSSRFLAPGGQLSLIMPSDIERMVLRVGASFGLYPFRVLRFRTTPSKPPRRTIVEFSRKKVVCREEEMTIGVDTLPLTADFYL